MLEYMFLPFRRYADFRGRSRRMEFWSFGLFNAIVYAIIGGIMLGTGFSLQALENGGANPLGVVGSLFFGGAGLLLLVYWLATIIPSLAVTVRRLHDRDMSGWWYLGFMVLSLIPLVGFIASIALLVIMFLPGTAGPNRFGPDPKDPASAQVFA
ncbi:uncharacterized membrane protein YhaH (DUF805 family) [Novosphingobium chloroacetimidivorans]|uniref:Uncharacterized membrane protein YhaH (DUF805 family) n=1 Tax=Novosphingobium chloroacetimidivorans TaxID=1428314 RepID=A0A7W7K8J5_9SPHN|nr:DUF805 domain-containing protein [Novosphingobium chloroacetimidivorans]MBB4858224.1 uncharacterized membrane protein YhaH (DUF805 family) [Novosphingobium chloroacetimidivorans]